MFNILGTDGKEYGPVSVAKVQEWMIAGRANLETKARRADEAEWKTLGQFPEFNAAATPAPAAAGAPPSFTPSPAAIVDPELASRLSRLGAALLDSLASGIFIGPGFVVLMTAGAFTDANRSSLNTPLLIAGAGLIGLGVLVMLGIQLYLLHTRGQTIGKKLVGIKIVDFNTGQNPGLVKTFVMRSFVNGLIGAVPFAGGVYSLVDICFIFRDDQRCIHDLLAGTKVVKA